MPERKLSSARRIGRPPKGERDALPCKVPKSLTPILDQGAAAEGLDRIDYIALVLLQAHGQDIPSYIKPGKTKAQTSIDGKTYGLQTYLPANVDSVTLGQNGGELMLNLAGLGSIALSKVQIIGQ